MPAPKDRIALTVLGGVCFVPSEHCYPGPQETLLNMSAPSPSSPTPLLQVRFIHRDLKN